jgi:hypothetical protein
LETLDYSMKRSHLLVTLLLAALASGCNFFAPPAAEQTRIADHAATATQIGGLRQTATVQADRLALTLEYAQTAVGAANAQSTRIAATLMATGMPPIDVRNITPLFATPAPDDVRSEASNGSAPPPVFAITPIISDSGAQGNSELLSPPTPAPITEQTIDPDAPHLTDIVITQAVGADDCAVNSTSVIPTNVEGVYVSAVAHNLTPTNVVVSRWSREGTEMVFYEWSPGFDIEEGCIWFYMPASDVDFTAGNWSVQLELDGSPVGTPAAFTLSGSGDSAPLEDAMAGEPAQTEEQLP